MRTSTRGSRNGRRLALGLAGCLAAAALAQPAYADPGPDGSAQPFVTPIGTKAPGAGQHVAAFADVLGDTAGDVLPLVADTVSALGEGHGYAGQKVNPGTRSIDLYWKGAVPADVSAYLADNGRGVKVNVHRTAAFTREEGKAAASRVTRSDLAKSADISSASVNHDGTGITLQMAGKAPGAQLRKEIAAVAGVDAGNVSYEENVGRIKNLATRANDSAPWYGGGRIVVNGFVCSTGFAALSSGSGRLLTANHCDPEADNTVYDGGGTAIATGANVYAYPSIDSQSIDPSASPATSARIYVGAWDSSSSASVKSWASNNTGDAVCSGGASTGTHCGSITDDAVTLSGLNGGWYVRARGSGAYMAGGGDSGGPIYRTVSGGVQARGTLIAGYTASATSCGAHNPDSNPTCYDDIVYLPISVALNSWGYSLEVE
ncbi:hypothetical protein AB0M28_37760 [Streptomyces sp. NPDC051940]|uniref:hypothetical protein n=1 Tax=Streptomyces sp. NPDC051940 TaxID=3155675 RepID=UPI00342F07B3